MEPLYSTEDHICTALDSTAAILCTCYSPPASYNYSYNPLSPPASHLPIFFPFFFFKHSFRIIPSLHPHPHPFQKGQAVLAREALVGELQPTLASLAGGLDGATQVVRSLGAPLRDTEAVLLDLVREDQ
jgi:hypothetical protein